MIFAGFDPGLTTGVCVLGEDRTYREGGVFGGWCVEDVRKWYHFTCIQFSVQQPEDLVVGIEDYVGGGARDKEAIHCLKLVGFLTGFFQVEGCFVRVQPPQSRRAFLVEAEPLVPKTQPMRKHVVDACAHALLARYKVVEQGEYK